MLLELLFVLYVLVGTVPVAIQYYYDNKKVDENGCIQFSNGAKLLTILFFPSFVLVAGSFVLYTFVTSTLEALKNPKESLRKFLIWWKAAN